MLCHMKRDVTPDDFCMTPLHTWDPETTFHLPKPKCPHCNSNGHVKRKMWGRPRAFIGADSVHWFVGRWYKCTACRRDFRNYVQEVLAKYPFYVQRCFPAIFTYSSGMDVHVFRDLRLSIAHKMSVRGYCEKLMEQHYYR